MNYLTYKSKKAAMITRHGQQYLKFYSTQTMYHVTYCILFALYKPTHFLKKFILEIYLSLKKFEK